MPGRPRLPRGFRVGNRRDRVGGDSHKGRMGWWTRSSSAGKRSSRSSIGSCSAAQTARTHCRSRAPREWARRPSGSRGGAARRRSTLVLTARPVEIETKLSFAGLNDLLEPVVEDVLPELPGPQRRAFEVALLIAPAREQPDPRGVAAAFLSALRTLAHDRQVLVAIDDLQWLDSSSLQVIGFAARRLGPEPVGFLFTRRTDERGSPARSSSGC